MIRETKSPQAIIRLTALWGLCESGLGGIMHLVKFPFTGLFVGGLAMIIICMLALHNSNPSKTILQATFIVILIKFTVSPQSPLPAYIAVAFQGLIGALLFQTMPYRLATLVLLVLGMAESALQGVLIATILYGKNLWIAIDTTVQKLSESLGMHIEASASSYFIALYTMIYIVSGIVIGLWSGLLPGIIDKRKKEITHYAPAKRTSELHPGIKKSIPSWITPIAILLFIFIALILNHDKQAIWYTILRTAAILILIIYVVSPLLKFILSKFTNSNKWREKIAIVTDEMPAMREAFAMAITHTKDIRGIKRYKEIIIIVIILAIYDRNEK